MLSDIRSYYGLTREISLTGQSTYFETTQSQHVVKELKLAIKDGKLIVLAGIVGTGKTTTLRKIQDLLEQGKEKEILVAKSLSVDGGQISLGTLILALFCDLTTEKDGPMPTQTKRRERALRALIRKRKKPVALFIDDAHQLHPKTLVGLKRLMEIVRDGKGTLSVVLAGHPKLKNDLLRPSMEEIGARTTLFELDGFSAVRTVFDAGVRGSVSRWPETGGCGYSRRHSGAGSGRARSPSDAQRLQREGADRNARRQAQGGARLSRRASAARTDPGVA